jgi:hypothetical protein
MTIHYLCDHSGAEIPHHEYKGPTRFAWEGTDYEFDLSTESARAFALAQEAHAAAVAEMAQWVKDARALPVAVPADPITEPVAEVAPAKPKRVRKPAAKATKGAAKRVRKASDSTVMVHAIEDLMPDEPKAATNGNGKVDPAKVREWAKANGHAVNQRGRISESLTALYREAVKG